MKLLFILNEAKHLNNFSQSSMLAARQLGITFHIAGKWSYLNENDKKKDEEQHAIRIHQIDFQRNPFHPGNIKAYRQLYDLMRQERYDAVHCNTPVGGLLGRICAKQCGIEKVIYTAHGFHFYQGAGLFNQTIVKVVEKFLARFTDAIVTMNDEDHQAAAKFSLRSSGKVYHTHGVGIDTKLYAAVPADRTEYCRNLGIRADALILISVGDLIERKGYDVSIRAVESMKTKNVCLLICGEGPLKGKLSNLCKKQHIEQYVRFLGFRNDIKELLRISDAFLLSSKQEGLPRSLMEAMASGLPCVASNIRGNKDLLEDGKGGFLCNTDNPVMFSESIKKLFDPELRRKMGMANIQKIAYFDISRVINEMKEIYTSEFVGTPKFD